MQHKILINYSFVEIFFGGVYSLKFIPKIFGKKVYRQMHGKEKLTAKEQKQDEKIN